MATHVTADSAPAGPALQARFDAFELDEANARLLRGGTPVPLAPTPFALLCALVRRPGSLLTKHALLNEVWGHPFLSESALKTAVSDLRAVLQDDAKQPRYIETVARRGYRFVGTVSAPVPRSGASRAPRPPSARRPAAPLAERLGRREREAPGAATARRGDCVRARRTGGFGMTFGDRRRGPGTTRPFGEGMRPLLAGYPVDAGAPGGLRPQELMAALDEHAIVSVADKSGGIVYVNELFCRTSGYTPSELLGSPHSIVKSGTHPPALYRDLWATISRGRVWHGELRNRRKDGTFYWVATTIVPTLDEQGLPLRYVSIHTDITAEKALDEELLQQRAFLANIAEAVGEGILVEDEHGRCVFANQEAAQLLGCAREALLGRALRTQIVDTMGPVDFSDNALEPTSGPELAWLPGRYEGKFIGLDGRRRPVLVSVQPMAQASGTVGTVIAFRDHSQERQQREALQRARTAADRASRAKSAFLANMSHEIRTPLNGVLGLARLALEESVDAPRLHRYLEGIVESAGALTELITDVLDLSRIEAGKLSIQRVEFELHDLLRSIHRCFFELAAAKGIELPLTIAPDVPARVTGDRVRVRQIVSNLLTNAIKFTPRGRVHLQATMTPEGQVRLAVEDTGIGVEADVMGTLFCPFVQADESTTRRYGGSGLGLSICRALAHELGGRVGAQSEPGLGSVFWAELPLEPARAQAPHADASPDLAPEDVDIAGMRVLLVEDNETNTVITSAILGRWGVDVSAAQSGREALELVDQERRRFDLVLMDLHMPGMSGYDVTRSLRTQFSPAALPIVALTAAAFEEDREQCYRAGMNDFVTKPVSAERLRATLVKWKARPDRPG